MEINIGEIFFIIAFCTLLFIGCDISEIKKQNAISNQRIEQILKDWPKNQEKDSK